MRYIWLKMGQNLKHVYVNRSLFKIGPHGNEMEGKGLMDGTHKIQISLTSTP
jgi:hypothetical protein